nr:hypothetical protein [Tanacetum cinerariifolium]
MNNSVNFRGMFVTRIARSFGMLTNEMVSVLSREPPPHVYRKTSLVKMEVIMELYKGECCWPTTREVVKEGKGDDEEGDEEGGNEGVGGSAGIYRIMSQCDWQIDQFLGYEADYPPYGYHGQMPPGYTYRPYPSQDGSS